MSGHHLDYARPRRTASGGVSWVTTGKATFVIAGSALALVAAGLAAVLWVMNAPAVPRSSLAKLRVGMTAPEVTQVLGTPDTRTAQPDGSQTWTYSRMTWAYLTVDFDANQTVVAFEHDD